MMAELKRYTPTASYTGTGEYVGVTEIDEEGDYVLYTDAMEAIRQARDEALDYGKWLAEELAKEPEDKSDAYTHGWNAALIAIFDALKEHKGNRRE